MTQPLSGFSLLDNEQDKAAATTVRRWRLFRSTVAFALQETFPLTTLTILWQPGLRGQEALLARVCDDIRRRLAERRRSLDLRLLPVTFADPFDLQDCFQVLWDAVEADHAAAGPAFFNLGNGTHTMQMAMLLLARYPPEGRPLHLLQVSRDRATADPLAATTWKAQARRLDLRWENLRPLERRVRREKGEILRAVALKRSRHPAAERLYREIVEIGCYTDDPLLLTGPTGTGKSRIAQEIHHGWARRAGRPQAPFLELNAAGLSGDLIRSTLFGHTRGAFTGATADRDGFLLAADRGTLFLDEIGELDLRSQAELLLALETRTFYPVGSTQRRTSDFRLLCATNQDLRRMVQAGTFREDLYTRIRCWEFRLPGIRDLPRDFEGHVDHEIRLFNAAEFRKDNPQPFQVVFEPEAKAAYLAFGTSPAALWAGNFRDLKFSVRRMAIKARLRETPITPALVAEEIAHLEGLWAPAARPPAADLDDTLARLEEHARRRHPAMHLLDAVEATLLTRGYEREGNKARVARWLYESPGQTLANPSNRFRERFKSLFP
ncbi:MAG: sigma 54-interacting transcriptional regulator [Candidatus Riflebacteria bacterium]|nr:sigma 54-interacting transcriptional regulator [Candidatus Riflebacteria bacterium]